MPPLLEQLSIFLASPSDVQQERKRVQTVIDEINRTVAHDKAVVLKLVLSKRAIPGYGKDGQAIINEQIGDMHTHDLFVGIMWNRIGTPTPRDISGTAEEYARAVNAWKRRKKPEIWFYFREARANLKTQDELAQKAGVLKFREKLRLKSLVAEYTTPQSFENMFREHLILWLTTRKQKPSPTPGTRGRRGGSAPDSRVPRLPHASRSTTTTTNPGPKPPAAGRKPGAKEPLRRRPSAVKSSGRWLMLNDRFFQAKSTTIQADRSIIVRIIPTTLEQTADLRSLQPGEYHRSREVTYADQHEAGTTRVQSVIAETSLGKTTFTVTLAPLPQLHNRSMLSEFSFNGYSADAIAELRARLILLGQPLPKDLGYLAASYQTRSTLTTSKASSIQTLPQLWTSLQTDPRLFLPQAWIYAGYLLRVQNVVETILALELGPINERKMHVTFRGRRAQMYINQEPVVISFEGECILEPSGIRV